ncbi:universal stress protein [uncultured Bacteroides sp.]|uniref:universal stress protein n=1 Tax=uncultured Bacteroides sp. TaxID=162156 RepID=UPI002AAB3C91|nr:universal stress protein [uncultured Bacteroides sp.]
MEKVLIAIDYDETAQKVAEEGYALAKAMNAQAILLHVLHERPNYYIDSPSVYEMHIGYIEDLKIAIQKFLDNTKKHLGDKHILTVLKEGDIAETILETARDLGVDIIVMGTHSRRWLENIIMGSDAKSVLKRTPIPLYIVPLKIQD